MICRIYFFLFFTSFIIAQTPFKIGESLQYHAEFNRVRVGEAELKVSAIEEINTIKSYSKYWLQSSFNTLFALNNNCSFRYGS